MHERHWAMSKPRDYSEDSSDQLTRNTETMARLMYDQMQKYAADPNGERACVEYLASIVEVHEGEVAILGERIAALEAAMAEAEEYCKVGDHGMAWRVLWYARRPKEDEEQGND